MKFDDIRNQVKEHQANIQDLISTCYVIYPVPNFYFISYYDLSADALSYTVTDRNMVEIKLLSDLDSETLIKFGRFVETLEKWQTDKTDFPFGSYRTVPVDLRDHFHVDSEQHLDGSEGELT